jgi:CheY-like chemotaxis protein
MESIGTLAGGIANDFNNLLGGIMGSVSVMEMQMGDRSGYQEDLREIKTLVNRGAELTRQLLGFARLGKYQEKPLDLNRLLDKTSVMFGRIRKDVVVHLQRGPILPVEADPTQLEQVLLNLLDNASDAMPNGGELTLTTEQIEMSEKELVVHGTAPGRYAKLSVTDTGVGMSPGTLRRIFDPFFTTKKIRRGTGLSLASAYGIIKNHGGFVTVQSVLGKGTTFTVFLPITDKPVAPDPVSVNAAAVDDKTILVVDDEEQIARTCSRLVEAIGFRSMTALSGEEALKIVREDPKKVSLVILDMVMPRMGGGDTFDALRQIDPSIKVILSSGYDIESEASAILDRGCNAFIQKPFSVASLSTKIQEVL